MLILCVINSEVSGCVVPQPLVTESTQITGSAFRVAKLLAKNSKYVCVWMKFVWIGHDSLGCSVSDGIILILESICWTIVSFTYNISFLIRFCIVTVYGIQHMKFYFNITFYFVIIIQKHTLWSIGTSFNLSYVCVNVRIFFKILCNFK